MVNAVGGGGGGEPVQVLSTTVRLFTTWLAVTISGRASPLRSPAMMRDALRSAGIVTGGPNPPIPSPKSTTMFDLSGLGKGSWREIDTARSGLPSLLKSATVRSDGN